MKYLLLLGSALLLSGCYQTSLETNAACLRLAGCVSSFGDHGQGPIQQQAVAPVNPGPLTPRR